MVKPRKKRNFKQTKCRPGYELRGAVCQKIKRQNSKSKSNKSSLKKLVAGVAVGAIAGAVAAKVKNQKQIDSTLEGKMIKTINQATREGQKRLKQVDRDLDTQYKNGKMGQRLYEKNKREVAIALVESDRELKKLNKQFKDYRQGKKVEENTYNIPFFGQTKLTTYNNKQKVKNTNMSWSFDSKSRRKRNYKQTKCRPGYELRGAVCQKKVTSKKKQVTSKTSNLDSKTTKSFKNAGMKAAVGLAIVGLAGAAAYSQKDKLSDVAQKGFNAGMSSFQKRTGIKPSADLKAEAKNVVAGFSKELDKTYPEIAKKLGVDKQPPTAQNKIAGVAKQIAIEAAADMVGSTLGQVWKLGANTTTNSDILGFVAETQGSLFGYFHSRKALIDRFGSGVDSKKAALATTLGYQVTKRLVMGAVAYSNAHAEQVERDFKEVDEVVKNWERQTAQAERNVNANRSTNRQSTQTNSSVEEEFQRMKNDPNYGKEIPRSRPTPPASSESELLSTLGVDQDATYSQIKRAYRELAKKHHPDVGGDKTKFEEITAAYLAIKAQRFG